jgi:PDZ domain
MALDAIRVKMDTISDVGYEATVEKPLGVVFGENRSPFNGLCIDSIAEGSNGEQAGMKVGDQLLAVNGQSVIGEDFDTAMDALRSAESPVELRLYKGLVSTLFTIVMNRGSDDDDDFEEETSEEVVFDESYESPVVMTFDDDNDNDKISVSAVAGEAVKNLGQMFGKSFSSMFSQETIQLEEKDGK